MYKNTLKRNLTTINIIFGAVVLLFLIFLLAIIYHNTSVENFIIESTKEKESKKIELNDKTVMELENTPKQTVVEKSKIAKKQETDIIKEDPNAIKKNANVLVPIEPIKSGFQIIVKDEAGNLIENAKIELIEFTPEKIIFAFTTKKDGQAELPEFPRAISKYINLKVSHPDFSLKSIVGFQIKNYSANKPLIIVLVKGFSVKGVVRDSNGNFLEGVEIHLKIKGSNYYDDIELPVIRSKKNGLFEFAHLSPGNITFSGSGNGYLLIESKRYTVPLKEEIILVYEKGRDHNLKITNINGAGIAKASVVYFFEIGGRFIAMNAETDEKGICVLLLSKDRNKRLIVSHPDFTKYDSKGIYSLHDTEPTNVILLKGNVLTVKVSDKRTLKPISNAFMSCSINGDNAWVPSIINSLGVYEFRGLPEGECEISASSIDYKSTQRSKFLIEDSKENIKNFELEQEKFFKLKLIDGNSKAPLACKRVSYLKEWEKGEPLITNENGELCLPIKDYSMHEIELELKVDGYANVSQKITPTDEVEIIELIQGTILQVFVKGQRGMLLDEMKLSCFYNKKLDKRKGSFHSTYNSITRCFEVSGLTAGKSDLIFYIAESSAIFVSVDLKLNAENKIELNLKLPYLLIFKVRSNDTNMVLSDLSGKIELQNESDYSHSDNKYLEYNEEKKCFECSIDSDSANSFILKFPYHLPTSKTNIEISPSGVSEYDFILAKGLGFEGVIIDVNGKIINNSNIEIESKIINDSDFVWHSCDVYGNKIKSINHMIKNQNGSFYAYGYTSGKYQIKVTHFDFIPYFEEVELANKSNLDMQVILKKGSQISGSVSSANGSLVTNTKIGLILKSSAKTYGRYNDNINYYAGTDSKGLYVFKNIPMGNYRLSAIGAAGHLKNYEIIVYENQDMLNQNIKLEDNLELSGVVVDEKGNPISQIVVYINSIENNLEEYEGQCTDSSGMFKFSHMLSKKYSLGVYSRDGYKLDGAVTAIGGATNVKLILKAPVKIQITGHVYLPDGKECRNYSISYFETVNNTEGEFIEPKISDAGFKGFLNIENLKSIKVIVRAEGFSVGESAPFNLSQYAGQPVLINLKNFIYLDLRVVDLYTRKPIFQAEANLAKSKDYGYDGISNKNCDEKGQIVLSASSMGKYTLAIRAAGYVDNYKEIEVLEKNEPIEILMGKGGVIKGQVLDMENKSISFILVTAFPLQEKLNNNRFFNENRNDLKATTDENGNFEIKFVPPGQCYLRTEGISKIQAKGLFLGIPLKIEESMELNISRDEFIRLTNLVTVNITLSGAKTNNKVIVLTYAKDGFNNNRIFEKTNENGKCSFLNIPKGEFTILVMGYSEEIILPLIVDGDKEINLVIPVE